MAAIGPGSQQVRTGDRDSGKRNDIVKNRDSEEVFYSEGRQYI